MGRYVDITFDCLPLRSVGRLDIPLDASPRFRQRCLRIKHAIETHGSFNTYFLYNAHCAFRVTNDEAVGMIQFSFEGTVLTDEQDEKTLTSDLEVELVRETCDWLTAPAVEWFKESVAHAVQTEFNLYIAAGDLERAHQRVEQIQAQADQSGGYLGMFL